MTDTTGAAFSQEQLIFVISPPRAGSTLLQRMLGAHSEIFTHPEPHLITPLAHFGYHARVDAAPYDHINAAEALRTFFDGLPHGEADYLDALRALSDTLYGRMLASSDKSRFLDKTPAYALVLPFLTKLYPRAKYVVLTRHPLAVFSSYANSFYGGDYARAHEFNPVLERYVPAMAELLRSDTVPLIQVRYERLVKAPEEELARIFGFLGLEHQPDAVNYQKTEMKAGMGDPINVHKESRPTTKSVAKWAAELAHDPAKLALAERMVAALADEDLELWGYPRESLFARLADASGQPPPTPPKNNYTLQRSVLLGLRSAVNLRPEGRDAVRKLRYFCDVVLRDKL